MSETRRAVYQQKADAELDQMKAKAKELRARAAGASAGVRAKLLGEADEMAEAYDEAKKRMKEMAEAGDEAWDEAKDRFDGAWRALKEKASSIGG
jgi:CHASE3 domain sensor protein